MELAQDRHGTGFLESQPTNGMGRLLKGRDVFRLVTLSRTTIWRRVREGTFPAPVSLGSTRIAWRESDIAAWMASQKLTTEVQSQNKGTAAVAPS